MSLADKDRIFTNLYGYQDWGLKAAQARGDEKAAAEAAAQAAKTAEEKAAAEAAKKRAEEEAKAKENQSKTETSNPGW